MTKLLILTAVTAVVLGVVLHREFKRIEQERRMRAFLETNPSALRLRRGFVELTITLRDAFTPAMRRVAAEVSRIGGPLNRLAEARLREANQYRKGGLPHPRIVDARDYEETR